MANRDTTHSYRWPQGGLIERIDIRQQSNGRAVAYLYADESEEARPARRELRALVRLKGWGTLSDNRDGKYALRISGLNGDGVELIDVLRGGGFITHEPSSTVIPGEVIKSKGPWDYIRNHSLRISGVIATVGNAMSIASGFHRGREIGQIGQGAAFAIADLPLAIAGERDDSRQQTNLLRQLKKHYEATGIEIPKNASIHAETSDKGKSFGTLAMDYMHRYANQIKCSFEVVAAGFTIHAGRAQQSSFKKYAPFIWGPGFAASLLIPERKIDPEKYEQAGTLERAWMKVQSNPLAIGGLLGYSNTVATYGSAYREREAWKNTGRNGTPLWKWDVAIPTVMIGANGTYAISKKTVGGDIKNDAIVSDVYIVAAQILNKQPDNVRDQAIASTAEFLGKRMEISDSKPVIVERLKQEMDTQRNSPWFEKTPLTAYTPEPKKRSLRTHRADEAVAAPATTVQTDAMERTPLAQTAQGITA